MTTVLRTRAGQQFGTDGFAAPESWLDAHDMDARSDIYSLGRVVAWAATTGELIPNVPVLPPGRWHALVGTTTAHDPIGRPVSMQDMLNLLREAIDAPENNQPDSSARVPDEGNLQT